MWRVIPRVACRASTRGGHRSVLLAPPVKQWCVTATSQARGIRIHPPNGRRAAEKGRFSEPCRRHRSRGVRDGRMRCLGRPRCGLCRLTREVWAVWEAAAVSTASTQQEKAGDMGCGAASRVAIVNYNRTVNVHQCFIFFHANTEAKITIPMAAPKYSVAIVAPICTACSRNRTTRIRTATWLIVIFKS